MDRGEHDAAAAETVAQASSLIRDFFAQFLATRPAADLDSAILAFEQASEATLEEFAG